MPDNINDGFEKDAQQAVYSRIYKRLNKIISIEQFLQSKELSFKSTGFIGLTIEKDIENQNEIYLFHYIESTGTLILDLEIKVKLDTKNKKCEVIYINDGFKTVYSSNKNTLKMHNWFIKWLWILQEERKECKK